MWELSDGRCPMWNIPNGPSSDDLQAWLEEEDAYRLTYQGRLD